MSVTGTPLPPSVDPATGVSGAGSVQNIVVPVLAAYGGDGVRNSLIETLLSVGGSGTVLSGTVTDVRADGSFTLQTNAGQELLLHHPPELPLTAGSTVTLRILTVSPAPQVAILTVGGKLVGSQRSGAFSSSSTTQTAAPIPSSPANALPAAIAAPPATLASTLLAAISLEDEVAIESILSGDGSIGSSAAQATVPTDAAALPQSIVATLVRPAPARAGSAPIAVGTRYLATLTLDGDGPSLPAGQGMRPSQDMDEDSESGTEPQSPAPSATGQSPTSSPPALPDLSNFRALTIVLAGRVLPPTSGGETLIETAVGTLAVPTPESAAPPGTAAQLKVVAVAAPTIQGQPIAAAPIDGDPAAALPPMQDLAQVLAQFAPAAAASELGTWLSLPPGDRLAAMILRFLARARSGSPPPWPEPDVRRLLTDAGRSALVAKLDADASQIGKTHHAAAGQWSVTVLPYLGQATPKPMRFYRRSPDQEEREHGGGERFVIELELNRLGAMQFDGLIREKRFDLVLRSDKPLDDELRVIVDRTFRDSLLISGWSGEISYAGIGAMPLVALQPAGPVKEISA